jgi:large subunit ribosomal protein L29
VRKASNFREMSTEDLGHEYRSAKEELFRLRYRVASGQLDDSKAVWRVRKEIARLATVLRAREIEAAKAAKQAVNTDV